MLGYKRIQHLSINKTMKSALLIFAITLNLVCIAQEPIIVGGKYNLSSKVLKENRVFRIALPLSYNDKKYAPASYPVLYVLDGEMAFDYYVSIVRYLSKGVYASIPEMIVVGIDNTDRTRDLTPTKSSVLSPDDSSKILFTNSGGGETFVKFISSELMQLIDSTYRTNGFKILAGHSFGGLAATNILLHHTSLFNAYLIHDPSLWWDHNYLLSESIKLLPIINFNKARVYLSQANNEEKGSFDEHFDGIKMFIHICDSVNNKTLALKYDFYEHEDHGTLPLPAAYNGLKYIFDGYRINFKNISKNKDLLMKSYQSFSDKMNFTFKPTRQTLDFIIKYFNENSKPEEAAVVAKQYHYFYPDDKK